MQHKFKPSLYAFHLGFGLVAAGDQEKGIIAAITSVDSLWGVIISLTATAGSLEFSFVWGT